MAPGHLLPSRPHRCWTRSRRRPRRRRGTVGTRAGTGAVGPLGRLAARRGPGKHARKPVMRRRAPHIHHSNPLLITPSHQLRRRPRACGWWGHATSSRFSPWSWLCQRTLRCRKAARKAGHGSRMTMQMAPSPRALHRKQRRGAVWAWACPRRQRVPPTAVPLAPPAARRRPARVLPCRPGTRPPGPQRPISLGLGPMPVPAAIDAPGATAGLRALLIQVRTRVHRKESVPGGA